MPYTEHDALVAATLIGKQSPCAKSKRGVVVFHRSKGLLATGWNAQPSPFICDGSDVCRANCNKLCVHAESNALHELHRRGHSSVEAEMLHVKVVEGIGVPSGLPSCWQCSREILVSGLSWFWLFHDDGLKKYSPVDFHEQTLRNVGLPVLR